MFTGLNGKQYICIVTGTCSPAAVSTSASLTVNTAPAITNVLPVTDTKCAGQQHFIQLNATGTGLIYQWQENSFDMTNGGVYSNVNGPTLNISD